MTPSNTVGLAVGALLLAGGGGSTQAVTLVAAAEPGCQLTNQVIAADFGHPGETLVDDAQRVCEGEWAYWPARATTHNKDMLIYKSAQTGKIFLIGFGKTSCEPNQTPETSPVPPRVQRAKGC